MGAFTFGVLLALDMLDICTGTIGQEDAKAQNF